MRKIAHTKLVFLGMAVLLVLTACGVTPETLAPAIDLEVEFSAHPVTDGTGGWELAWVTNADLVKLNGTKVVQSGNLIATVDEVTEFTLVAELGAQRESLDIILAGVSGVNISLPEDAATVLEPGTLLQLTASVTAEGSEVEPHNGVIWASSNEAVATVSADGLVHVVGFGTSEISATSIHDEAVRGVLEIGGARSPVITEFTAEPWFGDEGVWQLRWSVDASEVGLDGERVAPTGTLVVAPTEDREYVLVARNGNEEESRTISLGPVTVVVETALEELVGEPGSEFQLQASVEAGESDVPPAGTITWHSSNTEVAIVDADGLVLIRGYGSAQITARSIQSGAVSNIVTVTGARTPVIGEFGAEPWLGEEGEWRLFWDVDAETAELDGEHVGSRGHIFVSPVEAQAFELVVRNGEEASNRTVTLAPVNGIEVDVVSGQLSSEPGETVSLTAIIMSEGSDVEPSQQVTWSSSDESIATVDNYGLVSIGGFGDATITATSAQNNELLGTVTVNSSRTPGINHFGAIPWEHEGGEWQLSWETDANEVTLNGTPVEASGELLVTPASITEYTLEVRNGAESGQRSLELAPVSSLEILDDGDISAAPGTEFRLSVVAEADGSSIEASQAVTWSSSNIEVATVDDQGLIRIVGFGHAEVTATSNQAPGVRDSVQVTGKELPVIENFTATPATDEQGEWLLSWTASASNVRLDNEPVESTGTLYVSPDSVKDYMLVAANGEDVVTGSIRLAPVSEVEIAGATSPLIATAGTSLSLTALVTAAGSDVEALQDVDWHSSDESVVTVTDNGELTLIGLGSATVRASSVQAPAVSDSIEVVVAEPAVVTAFQTEPLTDGSGGWELSWQASGFEITLDGSVVSGISSQQVYPDEPTTYTLVARTGNEEATTAITLAPVSKVEIETETESLEFEPGTEVQFTANVLALESDIDASGDVSWSTSDEDVATVSDDGLVSVRGYGTATITARSLQDENVAASVAVVGVREPVINEFEAEPWLGDDAEWRLTWNVEADNVLINNDDVTGETEYLVAAGSEGAFTLTASNGPSTETLTIHLAPVSEIALDAPAEPIRLLPGARAPLPTAIVIAEDSDALPSQDITWTSDNTAVAIEDGEIIAQSATDSPVTIRVTSDQSPDVTASFSVEVIPMAITGFEFAGETPLTSGDELTLTWNNEGATNLRLNTLVTGEVEASSVVLADGVEQHVVTVPANKGWLDYELTWTHPNGDEHSLRLWEELEAVQGWVCTDAEDEVTIVDPLLRAEIRELYGIASGAAITCEDVQQTFELPEEGQQDERNLIKFNRCHNAEPDPELDLIESLEGVQHLVNLRRLELECNELEDIGLLRHMTGLVDLNLDNNHISDLTPLASLENLEAIGLYNNDVEDLTGLDNLINLEIVYLSENRIKDLSPLAGLENVRVLWLLLNCSEMDENGVYSNCLEDLSPLKDLHALETLVFSGNNVTDIGFISDAMVNLAHIDASNNLIRSIEPLSNLPALRTVSLGSNLLTDIDALAGNDYFPAGEPYTYSRGTANYPGPSTTPHHLQLDYNCFATDSDPAVTEMLNRTDPEVIIIGLGYDPRTDGCTTQPIPANQQWLRLDNQLVDPARLTFPGHGL